jgi:hypothetical protein
MDNDDDTEEVIEDYVADFDDYPRLEECDNKKCKAKCYSTCNITCNKCKETNELKLDTMYHCLDCVGEDKKFIGSNGQETHGFDLCKECFDSDPTYCANLHSLGHEMKKIVREEMIGYCSVCMDFFCNKCRVTSESLIEIKGWDMNTFEDQNEYWRKSVCNSCLKHFRDHAGPSDPRMFELCSNGKTTPDIREAAPPLDSRPATPDIYRENEEKEEEKEEKNENEKEEKEEEEEDDMWGEYLTLDDCANEDCKNKSYCWLTQCSRCRNFNGGGNNYSGLNLHTCCARFEAVYHCSECTTKDKKYIDKNGDEDYGFDLCKKCYECKPNYTIHSHNPSHKLTKVLPSSMLHECQLCDEEYCLECRVTSDALINRRDCLSEEFDDEYQRWRISICKKCLGKLRLPRSQIEL